MKRSWCRLQTAANPKQQALPAGQGPGLVPGSLAGVAVAPYDRSARRALSRAADNPGARMVTRVAILDDYQKVAERSADWSVLPKGVEVTFFHDHLDDPDRLVARLAPFEVIGIMRERTPFPGALLERLPNLRLPDHDRPAQRLDRRRRGAAPRRHGVRHQVVRTRHRRAGDGADPGAGARPFGRDRLDAGGRLAGRPRPRSAPVLRSAWSASAGSAAGSPGSARRSA